MSIGFSSVIKCQYCSIYTYNSIIILILFYICFSIYTYKDLVYEENYTTNHEKHIYENSNIFDSSLSNFKFFIFQIGFMKAGTTSLQDFFNRNGIPTIHYKAPNTPLFYTPLHIQMFSNHMNNTLLLQPYHNKYMYYSDFGVYCSRHYEGDIMFLNKSYKYKGCEHRTWVQILNKQYPNSKYILNIRNVNHWLKSRYTYSYNGKKYTNDKIIRKLRHCCRIKYNESGLVYAWKSIWYQYICELLEYFNKNNITDDLLIFDIENDNINKLVSFFEKHNLILNASIAISHSLKTNRYNNNYDNVTQQHVDKQFTKWSNIVMNNPELKNNHNEYQEISKQCNAENWNHTTLLRKNAV
eukprot:374710_1